ncbi:hypothetical protein BMF94_2849 [Rhodotorula taiwanensis]|uniref:HMG box domain-containing protein n=1 Tax=Rhodotorula taiwanensis TaxID=741276 RepID=A0A2S5BB91_9BASI|nr:hypothetical protein BMF94_2849 [Rhodotorula taiwanensis]
MPRNDSTVKKNKVAQPIKRKSATKKGKSSNYNAYMNVKLAELKKADPKLAHSDAFKKAFDAWKAEQKGKAK